MYTKIKTNQEIQAMRTGGKMCSEVLAHLKKIVTSGITTKELSDIAAKELSVKGGSPAFLGYQGFPEAICISVNDEVVHGIPKKTKVVKSGDIVSFDFGVIYDGMIVDSATSVLVDSEDADKKSLLVATRESLAAGINVLKHNCRTGDIGSSVEEVLSEGNYGVVKDLVGHGVGHTVHEDPNIPNFGKFGEGPQLKAGMTIAIEPMATMAGEAVYIDKDKWSVRTVDGTLSAHFEQTVLIKQNGYEILTPFL